MKPMLELDGLTKRFGEHEAVSGIDLEIAEGEFIAFMGPSGCGKTTTLRMIAGLEEPTSGEVRLNGERINERKPWERDTPHGVAEPRALPLSQRARERRVRFERCAACRPGSGAQGRSSGWSRSASPTTPTATSHSSRVASGSGWRWLERW